MDTRVTTPQLVFLHPQRLIVPLFQRPYVWNEENQWAPLWADITRLADRILREPHGKHYPHFLGAVVLQQIQNPTGSMQERTVIDGQQRLTTLQLLLDALHAELASVGATQQAKRIEALVANDEAYWDSPQDRFKVWPTNIDRPIFNEVMSAATPVDYGHLEHRGARLVEAHRFFAESARAWIALNGPEHVAERAVAIERTVRELLQLVVIDLTADENAQEIFETLNARGAQLTAADLIKNFVFQRLMESGVDVELAYQQNWKEFETGFWEAEVSTGRLRYSRSSIFLNHWLVARTGEEIVAREVFARFKRFVDSESPTPMPELLAEIRRASVVYRKFIEASSESSGPIDRVGLFAYRVSTLESEVFKPLVLLLLDPEQPAVPDHQLRKAFDTVESWLVRRMLVRAATNSYTQISAELITLLRKTERSQAGDTLEQYMRDQTVGSRYWPDDDEVRHELRSLLAYTRLRRARLRMVLEAIEDHRRGWAGLTEGLGGQRVPRGKYAIEHVMPRKWQPHWPLTVGGATEDEREHLVHTLGNLTLLTGRLNSKVSNAAWADKRVALKEHDVLKLNMDLLDAAGAQWGEEAIRARTDVLVQAILDIWPVPAGHKSVSNSGSDRQRHKVQVVDLIGAGLLDAGTTLYPKRQRLKGRTATVLPDGRIDVEGAVYGSPSAAASAMAGNSENGWDFFRLNPAGGPSLTDLWHIYVDQSTIDVDDSEILETDDDE